MVEKIKNIRSRHFEAYPFLNQKCSTQLDNSIHPANQYSKKVPTIRRARTDLSSLTVHVVIYRRGIIDHSWRLLMRIIQNSGSWDFFGKVKKSLVGGWTNPFETYIIRFISQVGSFPQVIGVKNSKKKTENNHRSDELNLPSSPSRPVEFINPWNHLLLPVYHTST